MTKALLIIDMINDFIHPNGKLYCGDCKEIIKNIKILGNSKKIDDVIFVCDSHKEDDRELKLFIPHAMKGTWGSKIFKELKDSCPLVSIFHRVNKSSYSGFLDTVLEEVLNDLRIDELILVGVLTDICIAHTCYDAYLRGYKITVISDATKSFLEKEHNFFLRRMAELYGANVVYTKDVVK